MYLSQAWGGWGGGGAGGCTLGISGDGDDRMGAKVKTQKTFFLGCVFQHTDQNTVAPNAHGIHALFHAASHCVVPENIHTPPTEGIGNSGEEGGGSGRAKNLK